MSAKFTSYEDILSRDNDSPPSFFSERSPITDGPLEIPIEFYTSRKYHELEKQHLWGKCWQMVCREEHLPANGDQLVYNICDKSYLLVRTDVGQIRAFVNACPHRGRRLRDRNGQAPSIRCTYHGFTWDLEGELAYLPCANEFTHIPKSEWRLPEVKVGAWGGYVFINPDPNASPFEAYIGSLSDQFQGWPLEDRYVAKHVVKKLRCNWKVAQEAFMEALHVSATHPQAAWASGDGHLTENDYISENVTRSIMPRGVHSPYLKTQIGEDEIAERMLVRFSRDPAAAKLASAPNSTARMRFADVLRSELQATIGDKADDLSLTEICDAVTYTVFPNLHPWGAFYRNSYLFKPLGDDHENCVFELMVLAPFKGDRPPPSEPEILSLDDSWTSANIGPSGPILDQDTNNIQQVQAGLHATAKTHIRLASRQESRISRFYIRYAEQLGLARWW